MAHFVKLGIGNKVIQGVVVHNDVATSEQAGIDFLNNLYNTRDVWKQTSYNTKAGVHKSGGTPFRKNYAGMGDKYDEIRDAFIAPKPYDSWLLNETTCQWEAPVEKPLTYINNLKNIDNNPFPDYYTWNETTKAWDLNE